MTFILGINAFHADASAALIQDGMIVGAVEEERFRRIKHWAGFPSESIKWCLKQANCKIGDIDHIAINTDPKAHQGKRVLYTLKTMPSIRFVLKRLINKRQRSDLRQQLSEVFPEEDISSELHFIEHHRAHLASAFYPSAFNEAAIVSVDGFGDFASGAWGFGRSSDLQIDGHIYFPHSLGAFYTAITQYLGFPNYGDEYKVMGLAPYGRPVYVEKMHKIVELNSDGTYSLNLSYFQHAGKKDIDHQWSYGSPQVGRHWSSELESLLGPARSKEQELSQHHMDIAMSTQVMYEEALFHLLDMLHAKYDNPNICIAGGCGANSVANGKISQRTKFKNVYVQAAAGDAGGALGAALDVWHQLTDIRCKPMENAYLGYSTKAGEINSVLTEERVRSRLDEANCSVRELSDSEICDIVSDALIKGFVVGWFEGKMEWGPRALGHRSILGDPRRSDMKEILNKKIKRRESFRPFAPSILRDKVKDWFYSDGDVPYMMQVFVIREEKRQLIPAVTHVDGTGRLQTVTEHENGRYFQLIRAFYEKTGVPMILNTSFNENEPIVCHPIEALDCFLRTKMDLLVLDGFVIERPQ